MSENNFQIKKHEVPEVVTFHDLELSLLSQIKRMSMINTHYLTYVSDGRQIFEFLLEFSVKYSSKSYLLIWSILRMQLFIGFRNIKNSLFVVIEYLLKDISTNRKPKDSNIKKYFNNYICDKDTFDIFFNLYRIFKEDLIRKEKIRPYIISILLNECNFNKQNELDIDYLKLQDKKGRRWILDFLNNLPAKTLNAKYILGLDAARGCLKIAENTDDKYKIWTYVNKII